jgi:calcineurin-like phosphoesterase family protein
MDYFTSDTHFGHANVIKYCDRPYKDQWEMNDALIKNWNSVVKPEDLVFHLGDFGFMNPPSLVKIVWRLNGTICLVPGNHDSRQLLNKLYEIPQTKLVVEERYKELSFNSRKIVLCHYPIESWNNMSHGSIHLHGHSHGKSRQQAGRFDVGVDSPYMHYKPQPLQYFLDMASKQGTPSRPEKYMREE